MEQELRKLYLDMVRRTVLGITFKDPSFNPATGQQIPFKSEVRENGEDWPVLAQTMIGNKRLVNSQELIEDIIKNKIEGDLVETGVWRGGSCIFMAAILKAWNETNRSVYVCDSFEGLPKPKEHEYPVDKDDTHWTVSFLSVPLEQVQDNFEGYGLLSDNVKFVKGWFSDTLPNLDVEKIALLRLDGDMYESTIVSLENLYPRLSVGGYVVVDDWGLPNCKRAVEDYRKFHEIEDTYTVIDGSSVYFQKTKDIDPEKAKHRFKNTEPVNEEAEAHVRTVYTQPNRGGTISSL